MYLLTNGWSLNPTSLAMIPEQCAMSWECWVLTPARAGHSRSKCLSSPKAPAWHIWQTRLCLGNCKWWPCSMGSIWDPTRNLKILCNEIFCHQWQSHVLDIIHHLSVMPEGSIYANILKDKAAAARQHPSCNSWAAVVVKQYSHLGMASPLSFFTFVALKSLALHASLENQLCKGWDGVHVSPWMADSKRTKLCT